MANKRHDALDHRRTLTRGRKRKQLIQITTHGHGKIVDESMGATLERQKVCEFTIFSSAGTSMSTGHNGTTSCRNLNGREGFTHHE